MSEPDKVAIATALSALIAVDVVGNSLVCVIIKKNRDLRYVKKHVVKCQTWNVYSGQVRLATPRYNSQAC